MEPIKDLDELAVLVQRKMPKPGVSGLKKDAKAGVVTFMFQSREFAVKSAPNRIDVFELKGTKLFITGASILAQIVIGEDRGREPAITAVIDSIKETEGALQNPQTAVNGLKLLVKVKEIIQRLARTTK